MFRVYVIETAIDVCNPAGRRALDTWQTHVPKVIGESAYVTHDAAKADLFYHPACLVDAYFQLRPPRHGTTSMLSTIENNVLTEIAAVSPGSRPVVINALRCYEKCPSSLYDAGGGCVATNSTPDCDQAHSIKGSWAYGCGAFPRLWGDPRFRRVCLEAPRPVHRGSSLQVPYCTGLPAVPVAPPQRRRQEAVFVGSALNERQLFVQTARHTPGVRVRLIRRSDKPHMVTRLASEMMASAAYTLCPTGDTPESQRIYQALVHGSVPLINKDFNAPPIIDWNAFSRRLCRNGYHYKITFERRGDKGGPLNHTLHTLVQLRSLFACTLPAHPTYAAYVQRSFRALLTTQPTSYRMARSASVPWDQRPNPNVALCD